MEAWCQIRIRVSRESDVPLLPSCVFVGSAPDSKALKGYLRIDTRMRARIGPGRAISKTPDRPRSFQTGAEETSSR